MDIIDKEQNPINLLFAALSKAQGSISAALKSKENPAFKREGKVSTYADIADVIEVIQKPASDNGLSVFFNYRSDAEGTFIQYMLNHSSGQRFISDFVFMFMRGGTAHDFGASNTFMRRQLLKSIYQIPEEDDDGNSASKKPEKPEQPKTPPPPKPSNLQNEIMKVGKYAGSTLGVVLKNDSASDFVLAHWVKDEIMKGNKAKMHKSYLDYLNYAEDEGFE